MGFSLGDFIQSGKEELKENYTSETSFFIQKSTQQFVYKKMQLLRIFPVHNFFVEREDHMCWH